MLFNKKEYHIEQSDKIVVECFNDWRRSTTWMKIQFLRQHDLLTDEHIDQMSDGVRFLLEEYQS